MYQQISTAWGVQCYKSNFKPYIFKQIAFCIFFLRKQFTFYDHCRHTKYLVSFTNNLKVQALVNQHVVGHENLHDVLKIIAVSVDLSTFFAYNF